MMEDNNYIPEETREEEPAEQLPEQLPRRVEGPQGYPPERPENVYRYGWDGQPDGRIPQGGPGGPGYYPPPYRRVQPPQPADSFAVVALIMGILSLMFAVLSGIGGIFLGAIGAIFAVLSRGDEQMPTQGKVGMGLSIGGMVLGGIVLLMVVTVISSGAFQREIGRELNRYGIDSELPEGGDDYDFYKDFIEDGGFYDDLPGV